MELNKNKKLLKLKNIYLDYGNFNALKSINLNIKTGEIHALIGEHGAGKSSLAQLISGIISPSSGEIIFNDNTYNQLNFKTSQKFGIEIVQQHIELNEVFSIAESLLITNKNVVMSPFFYSQKKIEKYATDYLKKYNFQLKPSAFVKDLNLSDKTLIMILRALYKKPKLLILDEAFEKLSKPSLKEIIIMINEMIKEGMSILLITHKIDDIYEFANKVSVIKNGELVLTEYVNEVDKINLIKFAYTQIEQNDSNSNREFYHLLKYNEAILLKLPINLLVIDNENKIKMVNDYAVQYFNIDTSTYLDLPIKNLFFDENKEIYSLLCEKLSKNELKSYYNIPILFGKNTKTTNLIIYPIYDGTFLLGKIIIIEDVTEREKLREQFHLTERLASVGLLAAGVAHEINNPLEIIYNYLEMLKYVDIK